MERWSRLFHEWYGKPLPDSYLVFDIETTGLKRDWALPVDIGHTIVRDRCVVHRGNFLLNWVDYPGVDRGWLEEQLVRVTAAMREQGKSYHYSIERLAAEGRDPYEVLTFYYQLFEKNRRTGASFVGHNAWFFDSVLFTNVVAETCDLVWEFKPNEIFDTGAIAKAILGDLPPYPDEKTLKQYFLRVKHAHRKGIKWSIEHCIEQFDLLNRFNLNPADLHGAGPDSYVAHLLFEEFRIDG